MGRVRPGIGQRLPYPRGIMKATAIAALLLAARPEAEGKTIVVLLADTGERYVTTALMTQPLR